MANSSNDSDKLMGILAYISILVLVPIFAAKDSKFARFHANQGSNIFVCEVIVWVLQTVLGILGVFGIAVIGTILNAVFWLISVLFLVVSIIGIVYVLQGNQKEVPVFGKLGFNLADRFNK